MGWPIPALHADKLPPCPDVVLTLVGVIGAILCGVLIAFSIDDAQLKAMEQASRLGIGLICGIIAAFILVPLGNLIPEYRANKAAAWNGWRKLELENWRYWTHQQLAVLHSNLLLPEPDAAARMAGLEPQPPELATAKTVLFPGELLPAGPSRFERIARTLLPDAISVLKTAAKTTQLHVWLAGDHDDATRDQLVALWKTLELPAAEVIGLLKDDALTAQDKWLDNRHRTLTYVVLAVQHHTGTEDQPSEAAALLVLTPDHLVERMGLTVRNHLCRTMRSAPAKLATDMATWLEEGQQPKDQVKQLWLCGLDKAAQHSVKTLAQDMALPLRQNAPAFGMLDVDKALGEYNDIAPWVTAALATELVSFHQGSQGMIYGDGKQIALQLAGLGPQTWYAVGHGVVTEGRPPILPTFLLWGFAFATFLAPIMTDPQGNHELTTWLAGALLVLSLAAPFIYVKLASAEWAREFDWRVRSGRG